MRARADWPFVWGVHDCCTFCADAVQAITGVDVMGTLRQRYQSAFEALALTQELGGLQAAVSSVLGEPCSPALCTVGDVLLLRNEGREVVALCDLNEMSYAEAAAALGCAVGTVRSRLHRARAMLLEIFTKRGIGTEFVR